MLIFPNKVDSNTKFRFIHKFLWRLWEMFSYYFMFNIHGYFVFPLTSKETLADEWLRMNGFLCVGF